MMQQTVIFLQNVNKLSTYISVTTSRSPPTVIHQPDPFPVRLNRPKKNSISHPFSSTQTSQNPVGVCSYHLCGKGLSPLSSPPIPAGPEPSGRWPAAWCQVRTGSYTCTASAWPRHASNRTCGRSRHCRRWWHSSPLLHWRWQTCDLLKQQQKFVSRHRKKNVYLTKFN